MKFFLIISVFGLLSFGIKNSESPGILKTVWGNWKGCYGTTSSITDLSINFAPGNTIEFFSNNLNSEGNGTGFYKIIGDTAIVITCSFISNPCESITLKGRMNKTKTFVDGEWEMMDSSSKGCFYLQKNAAANN